MNSAFVSGPLSHFDIWSCRRIEAEEINFPNFKSCSHKSLRPHKTTLEFWWNRLNCAIECMVCHLTGADRESDSLRAPLAVIDLSNLEKALLFLDFKNLLVKFEGDFIQA